MVDENRGKKPIPPHLKVVIGVGKPLTATPKSGMMEKGGMGGMRGMGGMKGGMSDMEGMSDMKGMKGMHEGEGGDLQAQAQSLIEQLSSQFPGDPRVQQIQQLLESLVSEKEDANAGGQPAGI